ncbi:recombination protein F [Serratia marcescens]|nr:recombination protein F [Serratia marcescens]CAI0725534.1 recombination protein F [Serratia marcescens]HEB0052147.1 AAA family ATPase [Serratia marcescens]HEB0069045.1 AAA family ATPase [Serratia marcescens]HEB0072287.1 AAA family ATPase [Serratia marcescens]
MNDVKRRVDNVFSDFIEIINDDNFEKSSKFSHTLNLLNESLNKEKLYLKKVAIVDFKRLRDVIVNLEDDLTVFVADNGYGKTTLLDAIAISLSWLRSNIQKKDKPGSYIREIDINNSKDALYASVVATFKVQNLNANILITSAKEGVSFKRSNDLQEVKSLATMYRYVNTFLDNSSLPVMAYYSIVRSVVGGGIDNKRKSNKNKTSWSKFDVYDDFIFDRNDFGEFLSWLMFLSNKSTYENASPTDTLESLEKEIERISNTIEQLKTISNIDSNIINNLTISREEKKLQLKKVTGNDTLSSSSLYKNVINTILKFLPEFESINLVYSENDFRLVLLKNGIELDAQQLSQGEKTILTLVGDLARRLSLLNPTLQNPFEGKGIVLIDEIDLHLHPTWQQKIIERLLTTFPNVQFVLSTHSPQVLSTVSARCIRILEEVEDELGYTSIKATKPRYQTKGLINSDALLYGMGTDPTPPINEVKWLEEYKKNIELDKFDSKPAITLRNNIIKHFGEEHPLVIECDQMIALMKMKRDIRNRKNNKES